MIVRHRFAAFALCCHAALLLTLLLLCQTPVVFGASNPPPPPNDVRLPNGRTSIKINPGLATTTAGQTPHTRATSQHQRAGAAPILFRQPNPALPPPFLNVNAAVASSPPPANTDADSTIDVTYYGDAEGDSNLEAAGSSNTAADAQALPPDETGTVHFPPQSPEATAWLELSGHCWTHTTSKYVYSFCPFQNVTQKSTTSVLHVVLGVFDEWIDQGEAPVIVAASSSDAAAQETATPTPTAAASASHDGLVMSYTDGTACGNGKRRSTRVYFLCSTEPGGTRIGDVTEPATCEYEVTFSTPLMCTPEQRAQALEAAGGESDHAIRQAMQTCINILYAHVSTPLHSRLQLPKEVRDTCVNYIPELRASYEDEDNKAAAAARAAVKPAAAGTPPATPAAVTYDSSVAAPTTDSSQPIRANIPASISQADDSAVSSAPTPSRAPPAEELSPNGDVRPEVAASPYAELDKRHSEEL
jgi:hypothetical protein